MRSEPLYDVILDDLEDEVTTTAEDAVELVDKAVEEVDDVVDDDLLVVVDSADGLDLDADASAEELLASEELESWSDDPVRMYLTQMGEIPLLTRKEEIYLAKKIEVTRAKFRGR